MEPPDVSIVFNIKHSHNRFNNAIAGPIFKFLVARKIYPGPIWHDFLSQKRDFESNILITNFT